MAIIVYHVNHTWIAQIIITIEYRTYELSCSVCDNTFPLNINCEWAVHCHHGGTSCTKWGNNREYLSIKDNGAILGLLISPPPPLPVFARIIRLTLPSFFFLPPIVSVKFNNQNSRFDFSVPMFLMEIKSTFTNKTLNRSIAFSNKT